MLPSDPNQLLSNKVNRVLMYVREYWVIADRIIKLINRNGLTGIILTENLNESTQILSNLQNLISGVNNSNVREELALQFNILNINKEIRDTNNASNKFLKSMSELIASISLRGKVLDVGDTNAKLDAVIASPDNNILLNAALELRDNQISNPNL